jgi:hypothetical protein
MARVLDIDPDDSASMAAYGATGNPAHLATFLAVWEWYINEIRGGQPESAL